MPPGRAELVLNMDTPAPGGGFVFFPSHNSQAASGETPLPLC
jgi:hypothetical protein